MPTVAPSATALLRRRSTWLAGLICTYLLSAAASRGANDSHIPVEYNRDIRPILADSCFHCHGPADDTREADLRLDERENAISERGGYRVIDIDQPAKSVLLERIESADADLRMPPPDSGQKPLTGDQVELIRAWIDQGAEWQKHWAFITPKRPKVPHSRDAAGWALNPIDYFIFDRMRDTGLRPKPPANPRTLVRRAALAVTGLPPTPGELRSFGGVPTVETYELYVDRLLNSSAYAEHQARFWLDAARYGDTHGMHLDNYREIWPYRDWVIKAFQRNMPFDDFIIEQLAGDMLPQPTVDQRVATGFNRCNVTSSEAGSIKEELAARYAMDRVDTFGTVFLGLTVGCAQCHDHKFDPISQREYYQLYAFFNNAVGPAMDGNRKDTPPNLVLPHDEHAAEWNRLRLEAEALRKAMADRANAVQPRFRAWRAAGASASLTFTDPVSTDGLVMSLPLDEGGGDSVVAVLGGREHKLKLPNAARWDKGGPTGSAIEFLDNVGVDLDDVGQLAADKAFTLSFWLRTPAVVGNGVALRRQSSDAARAGWSIGFDYRYDLTMQLVADSTKKDALHAIAADSPLKSDTWFHLCISYNGSRAVESFTLRANGEPLDLRIIGYDRIKGSTAIDPSQVLEVAPQLSGGALSRIRLYDRLLSEEEMTLLAEEPLLAKRFSKRTAVEPVSSVGDSLLFTHYLNVHDKEYQSLSRRLVDNAVQRDRIRLISPTTLVMQERMDRMPRARVFDRGQYDQPGEKVSADVPAVFPALPDGKPANRLTLAHWLTAESHPLTARVAVNRIWQNIFGRGLVETAEDFGTRGAAPTHPELLDWLAVELVESGWDYPHIVRLIVTSATFRQQSARTPQQLDVDPENILLSSGPRVRLDAEVLRDQALAVSELLVRKVGGPSVKPYQPPGIWEAVAFVESNTEFFHQDSGKSLYRRSLYTFWKRTAPPPSLAIFNAPTREVCTVRRERTNTPLQALVLLNDPQFVEAARCLAENIVRTHSSDEARLNQVFAQIVGRPIREAERQILLEALARYREYFSESPARAEALVAVGDSTPDVTLAKAQIAAWTMVASTIFNRDDVINLH